MHVVVELSELPIGIAGPKVVAPSPQNSGERIDHLTDIAPCRPTRIGQLVYTGPDLLHRPRCWPPLHKVPVRHSLNAPTLANDTAEEREAFLPMPQVHQTRLLRDLRHGQEGFTFLGCVI